MSATNVAHADKRGNICVGNNVSATMCPRFARTFIARSLYANEAYNTHNIVLSLECTGLFKVGTKIFFAREKQFRNTKYAEYFLIFLPFF